MSVLKPKSIESRLQIGLTISLALLMGLLWIFGAGSIEKLSEDFIASRLEHDAESILGAIVIEARLSVEEAYINQIYHRPFSGHYFLIVSDNGSEVTSRSLWDYKIRLPILKPGESERLYRQGPDGQQLLVWLTGYRKKNQNLTIAVAEDLLPITNQRQVFLWNFALLSILGLLLLLLIQSLVVRLAFRRLEPLREDVRHLSSGCETPLNEDVPNEMLPLVKEVNHLLQLLAQRNQRTRNALGNLAHALKGPLNLLTGYFDRQVSYRGAQQHQQAGKQLDRIRLLIDRELKRARLSGERSINQKFNAKVDLPDLLDVLRKIYHERNLSIEAITKDECPPFGDREDILELLGNLLDNACKWAEGSVICQISCTESLSFVIEDDGVGLEESDLRSLMQRGSRLDESTEGHGLGLAIVHEVVQLYRGEIHFDRSPQYGGLRVTVVLKHPY
ncbi:MAG: sensor histidine kinase [Candidatus Thiodiazotropha taylori]|nr:sensor histidine kinase [Candidatus Thiodiazotropha taylori]MCW4328588.1 sensor histidine kinase [Candidatus Thiodiazotropha taylori]